MPVYTFQDKTTEEIWTYEMSIAEKEHFIKENSHIQQLLVSMNIVSGVGGIRTDDGFDEMLQKVAENNPNTNLAASMGSKKSSKEVKTHAIVEKWRKKRAASLK